MSKSPLQLIVDRDKCKISVEQGEGSCSSRSFEINKAIFIFCSDDAENTIVQLRFPRTEDLKDYVSIDFADRLGYQAFRDLVYKVVPNIKTVFRSK